MNSQNLVLILLLSTMIATPSLARGGGRGFGSFGGDRSFGDAEGGRSFGNFGGGRSFGDAEGGRSFGNFGGGRSFGSFGSGRGVSDGARSFGGGFNHAAGEIHPQITNYGGSSFGNRSGFANPARDRMTNDSSFSHIAGLQNRSPRAISNRDLETQGNGVRNSFNNNTVNRNGQYNRYNVNRDAGYGYHPYGYGAYGYHPYGYGYAGWGYPGAWYAPGLSSAALWTYAGVGTLGAFLGMANLANSGYGEPASSGNVVYEGDNVYVNGQPSGTAGQYYQQAQQLAQTGQAQPPVQSNPGAANTSNQGSKDQQWEPLGVFALADPGQTQSSMLLQMAIDKDGVVRGNYFNQLTNESAEIFGALDKSTQRVSWTIGTNPATVFDAGLGDLIKNESSVLVHYGPKDTSRMALIRLKQPTGAPPGQQQMAPGSTAPS